MTTVNTTNDQSNDNLKSNLGARRRSRVGLAIAVAGVAVTLTGVGVIAGEAMASGAATQPRNVVVGHDNRPQAPVVHGQLVDDWPWTPQATP